MNRIVASIASLAEHLLAVATNPEVYRPAACPHCGLAGAGSLHFDRPNGAVHYALKTLAYTMINLRHFCG